MTVVAGAPLQLGIRRNPEGSFRAMKDSPILRRIEFDAATFVALDRLARDRMQTLQELADEAFRDLLKKHRRPTTLKEMLRESVRSHSANDHRPTARKRGANQ
jgi:hypothetical protein